jgi:hypothetical protein
MVKFCLEKISAAEALPFWEKSPYSGIFTHPDILSALSSGVNWWLAFKGKEPLCLWPVPVDEEGNIRIPGFTYWVGPQWLYSFSDIPAHRALSLPTQIYSLCIERFIREYGEIRAELPPGLDDVRTFDWHNYHSPDKPRILIKPRYTARITQMQNKSEDEIFSCYRELRRREVRSCRAQDALVISGNCSLDELYSLYEQVILKENELLSVKHKATLSKLFSLTSTEYGELLTLRHEQTGEIASMVLLLYGKGIANMVLNLSARKYRNSGIPAFSVHSAIMKAKKDGQHTFDFNGANSPERGDDKHSYGASPHLYFQISYKE